MRKVYGIWFARRVLPFLCLEIGVFSAVFFSIQTSVSFGHVMNNAVVRATQYPLSSFGYFWYDALFNAELLTLVMVAGAAFVGSLMFRDTLRFTKKMRGNFFRFPRVI